MFLKNPSLLTKEGRWVFFRTLVLSIGEKCVCLSFGFSLSRTKLPLLSMSFIFILLKVKQLQNLVHLLLVFACKYTINFFNTTVLIKKIKLGRLFLFPQAHHKNKVSGFFLIFTATNKHTLEKTRIYQSHLNSGLCRGFVAHCRQLDDWMQEYPRRGK